MGRHLLPVLAREYALICLVREAGRLDFLPGAGVVVADLSDPSFARHLPARADGILHMAVAPPSLAPAPAYAFQVNAASVVGLLEWGKRAQIERFVFTSSGSVYAPQTAPITEDVPPRPVDLLGVAKVAAEMAANLYQPDFAVVNLRIWRPYGPGQPANFLIPRLAARIRAGQAVVLNRGGHPRANTIYIDDLVEVLHRALRLEQSLMLNVAHAAAPSIYDVCQELAAILSCPVTYQWRDEEVGDLIAEVSRLQEVLDFAATIPLAEGLRRSFGEEPRDGAYGNPIA